MLTIGYHGHVGAAERSGRLAFRSEVSKDTGLETKPLGTVAHHLTLHAPCTVLIAKTEGRLVAQVDNS